MQVSLFAQLGEDQWGWDAVGLLSVPALVILNGLFVAAEFALVSVRRTRVEEMVRLGLSRAKTLQEAIDRLDRSIAATQLGITLATIVLGWVGEPSLAWLLSPLFQHLPPAWHLVATHSAATTLSVILITFVHVVFGELVPKNFAIQTPDRVALWLAAPLVLFSKITRPLTLVMSGTANAVLRLFGYDPSRAEEMVHSVEELALLIEDTEEAGILEPEEAEIVQKVFRLSDKRVGACLVPRDKMATLELNTPPDKVLEAVRSGAHTRMPVYEGELDNIVGVVNTKDLFYLFSLHGLVVLGDALYEALFLKPEDTMADALRLFRRVRRPMALVRDANGKILGLITLEDVLEEIIGDIEDEHDRPTPKLKLAKGRYRPRPRLVPPAAPPALAEASKAKPKGPA